MADLPPGFQIVPKTKALPAGFQLAPSPKVPGFQVPAPPGGGDSQQEQDEFALAIDNTVRSIADIFSFGFADELAAGANAALGQGDFETNLAAEQARDEAIKPGEKAAAFATSLAVPAGPVTKLVQAAPTTLGRVGRSVLAGAGAGGLTGAGIAGEGDRLRGAGIGAVGGAAIAPVGAALAPIAGAVGSGLRRIGRKAPVPALVPPVLRPRTSPTPAQRALPVAVPRPGAISRSTLPPSLQARPGRPAPPQFPQSPAAPGRAPTPSAALAQAVPASGPVARTALEFNERNKALQAVREAFRRDEIGFQQASRKVRQLGPNATLADVGRENVQSGLAAAANLPGTAKRMTGRVLETRVRQQNRRLRQAVQDGISDQDFDATVTGTIQRRAETAKPLYDAARGSGIVDNPKLDRLMRLKSVQASIGRVRDRNPDLLDVPDNDMRVLDAVYKDLGGQRQAAIRAGEKGSGALGFDLGKRQENLLDAIADDVPVYRDAVRIFADESALLDAAELGRKFMREEAEITARTMKDFTDAEREMFLTGSTKAVTDMIEGTPDASNAVRKIFGNERKRKQLRSLFPSNKAFNEFKTELLIEQRFAETRNAVIPGSRTTPLAGSILDQGKTPLREAGETVAEAAITGEPTGGFVRRGTARIMKRFLEGSPASEGMRAEIAKSLTTQGIEANQQLLDEIFERALEDALNRGP